VSLVDARDDLLTVTVRWRSLEVVHVRTVGPARTAVRTIER